MKSRAFTSERVDVEGRLLVRMRRAQRRHDLGLPLLGEDGLEPQLGDALLAARLARRSGRVPSPPRNVPVPSVYQEQRS